MSSPAGKILSTLGVVLLVLLGILALWIIRAGGFSDLGQLLTTGAIHQLQPALFQSAPLRTDHGGADRVYLLSTQSETILGASGRRSSNRPATISCTSTSGPSTPTPPPWPGANACAPMKAKNAQGRDLRGFDLLGVDGKTLWLTVDGPLGVSLADGSVVADGARIDAKNPNIAGKRVDELGYTAFGRHGLQVTLNDASQWRIDASDLSAAPRDTEVRDPKGILPPVRSARGSSSAFVTRALFLNKGWLGVMTDKEAEFYRNKPVIPGRDPTNDPARCSSTWRRTMSPPR